VSFEKAFAEYLGCKFARAAASGRDALEIALVALQLRPGDEAIIPAYTLGELIPLIQALDLKVIPADIYEDTFNIDIEHLKSRFNEKTRVVIATHLLGSPCNIEAICALAKDRNVYVIEDCAHALGAHIIDRKVGTFGDAAIFSFESTKALPTYGGGMIATNRSDIIDRAATILNNRTQKKLPVIRKTFFTWMEELLIRSPFYSIISKILFSESFARSFEKFYRSSHDRIRSQKTAYSDFQARLGLRGLRVLDDRNDRLNRRWNELAQKLPYGFTAQKRDQIGSPAFYNFVCLIQCDPSEFRRQATRYGIDIGIGSEVEDDCGRLLGFDDCPETTRVFKRAIMLPLYEALSDAEFNYLISVLDKFAKQNFSSILK